MDIISTAVIARRLRKRFTRATATSSCGPALPFARCRLENTPTVHDEYRPVTALVAGAIAAEPEPPVLFREASAEGCSAPLVQTARAARSIRSNEAQRSPRAAPSLAPRTFDRPAGTRTTHS